MVDAETWQQPKEALHGPLPMPPTHIEKYSFVDRKMGGLTIASIVGFTCLTISMTKYALISPWLYWILLAAIFTAVYFVISLRVNAFSRDFDLDSHKKLVDSWERGVYPTVDVFLPTCGEDMEILRNAWDYISRLRYPGTLTVYCLDDGADPRVRAMAAEFGFEYMTRLNRGEFKKAGNLRFGFQHSDGEFIALFDADFCPRAEFLLELLPYMDEDPNLGIVQSPQYFHVREGQNWLERGAGAVQEFFYRAIQTSRQHRDGAICVGSNAIYRREALESNGGTTLIEHSEDVHTGFDLRRNGWDLLYVPLPMATGLCPSSVPAFFRQQYRWCAGSMSLLRSEKFWQTEMPLKTRLCYLSGFFYYIHTAAFTFVGPLIPLSLLYFFPEEIRLQNYIILLPALLYSFVLFVSWHLTSYRSETWSVKMIYGWAHAFAILDTLRGKMMGWESTGGVSKLSGRRYKYFRRGKIIWGGGTAVALIGASAWYAATWNEPLTFLPILLLSCFYGLTVFRVIMTPDH